MLSLKPHSKNNKRFISAHFFLVTCILSATAMSISSAAAKEPLRKWSSAGGTFSVQAQLLEIKNDVVVLQKPEGKVIRVPQRKLSTLDNTYLEFCTTRIAARKKGKGLLATRAGFSSQLSPAPPRKITAPDQPPQDIFKLIKYGVDNGQNTAYLSPDPTPNKHKKYPAVMWLHGGFEGIGSYLWEPAPRTNDQSAAAFRNAGIIVMCPSWRGENDNPGSSELFYGEVDDLLAARAFLAKVPYVDPDRIYLAGHSTGGTLALLAATATNDFRAIFSFGGAPDIERLVSSGRDYGNTRFDIHAPKEGQLRSAIRFVDAIETPTFYFEGKHSSYCNDALKMQTFAENTGTPFHTCIIEKANHFNILAPLTELVATAIIKDTDKRCNIDITQREATLLYEKASLKTREERQRAVASMPVIELSASAEAKVKSIMLSQDLNLSSNYLLVPAINAIQFSSTFDKNKQLKITQNGLNILVPKENAEEIRGHLIDFTSQDGQPGFKFIDRH